MEPLLWVQHLGPGRWQRGRSTEQGNQGAGCRRAPFPGPEGINHSAPLHDKLPQEICGKVAFSIFSRFIASTW